MTGPVCAGYTVRPFGTGRWRALGPSPVNPRRHRVRGDVFAWCRCGFSERGPKTRPGVRALRPTIACGITAWLINGVVFFDLCLGCGLLHARITAHRRPPKWAPIRVHTSSLRLVTDRPELAKYFSYAVRIHRIRVSRPENSMRATSVMPRSTCVCTSSALAIRWAMTSDKVTLGHVADLRYGSTCCSVAPAFEEGFSGTRSKRSKSDCRIPC